MQMIYSNRHPVRAITFPWHDWLWCLNLCSQVDYLGNGFCTRVRNNILWILAISTELLIFLPAQIYIALVCHRWGEQNIPAWPGLVMLSYRIWKTDRAVRQATAYLRSSAVRVRKWYFYRRPFLTQSIRSPSQRILAILVESAVISRHWFTSSS